MAHFWGYPEGWQVVLSSAGAPKHQGTLYWGTLSTSCHQQGLFQETWLMESTKLNFNQLPVILKT